MGGAEHPKKRGRGRPKKEKGRGKRRLSSQGWEHRPKGGAHSVKAPSPTCDTVAQAVKKRCDASKQLGREQREQADRALREITADYGPSYGYDVQGFSRSGHTTAAYTTDSDISGRGNINFNTTPTAVRYRPISDENTYRRFPYKTHLASKQREW
jgi:hypothetical protein